jgi:hypothetical protein
MRFAALKTSEVPICPNPTFYRATVFSQWQVACQRRCAIACNQAIWLGEMNRAVAC